MATSHTMEYTLENASIPKENLLGKEGQGFKISLTALNLGRITIASIANGLSTAALNVSSRYAKEREQFGKPIGSFQGISFMLADMSTSLEAAKLLTLKAADLEDSGESPILSAAQAKLFATDAAMKITTDAVQILGGAGYTKEFPVERYMREAKVLQIVEGTNQIQRAIIGRTVTDL